jgi:DNA-binding transcriptional MerR regulator
MSVFMDKKVISAQEIVSRFNTPYYTVNYYTAIGLLPVSAKVGNKRMYEENVVRERLRKISELAREGYPLNLIQKKLSGA